MVGVIIAGCATKPPVKNTPPYKIHNGVKLFKQVPDTIRNGKVLIINNSHNAKVFIDSSVNN